MISRPAINPVALELHPQVLFPADSNMELHIIQCLTLILIGERFAKRLAWFLSSISFTTEGGSLLTREACAPAFAADSNIKTPFKSSRATGITDLFALKKNLILQLYVLKIKFKDL